MLADGELRIHAPRMVGCNHMIRKTLLTLALSSLSFAACGGGDGGGSGIDGSRDASTLTDAEIIEVCEYAESLFDFDQSTKNGCYAQAVFTTMDAAACETTYQECMAAAATDPDTQTSFECEKAPEDDFGECTSPLTVAELEACFEDSSSQAGGITISCSTTREELSELSELPQPASCTVLDEKCPELF